MPRPPPPCAGLDDRRAVVAEERFARAQRRGFVGRQLDAGDRRDPVPRRLLLGLDLVAEELDRVRAGTEERHAGRAHGRRELMLLGQEAVAGVDRVDRPLLRDRDDLLGAEVRADRRPCRVRSGSSRRPCTVFWFVASSLR
jgi:hypothetical protein